MLYAKTRVLIVDDEPLMRTVMSLVLAQSENGVRLTECGFPALAELPKELPPVCLSGVGLPGMDGFDLLSIVRSGIPPVKTAAMRGTFSGRCAFRRYQIVSRFTWVVGSKRLPTAQGE